jgi:hypothetical protein
MSQPQSRKEVKKSMTTEEREEREKILQKIRKLKEQADSTEFDEEADTCWRLIGQIIAKYQIEMEEVEDLPEGNGDGRMGTIEVPGLTNVHTSYRRWENILAQGVALVFDCETVYWQHKRPWTIVFMGRRRDLDLAVHFYDYLRRTVNYNARRKWRGDSRNQGVYATSCTNTLCRRLREAYMAKETVSAETTAIVHTRRKETEKFRDGLFDKIRESRARGITGDREAVVQGLADGNDIPLSRPIHGTAANKKSIE